MTAPSARWGYQEGLQALDEVIMLPKVLNHLILEYSHPTYVWYHWWEEHRGTDEAPLELKRYTQDLVLVRDYLRLYTLGKVFPQAITKSLLETTLRQGDPAAFHTLLAQDRQNILGDKLGSRHPTRRCTLAIYQKEYIIAAIQGDNDLPFIRKLLTQILQDQGLNIRNVYLQILRTTLTHKNPESIDLVFDLMPRTDEYLNCALRDVAYTGDLSLVHRVEAMGSTKPDSGMRGAIKGRHRKLIEYFLAKGVVDYDKILSYAVSFYPEMIPEILRLNKVVDFSPALKAAARHGHLEWLIEWLPKWQSYHIEELVRKALDKDQLVVIEYLMKNHRHLIYDSMGLIGYVTQLKHANPRALEILLKYLW